MKQMYTRRVGRFLLTTSKLPKNTSCCSQIRPERITWFFCAEQNKNIQMYANASFCIWQIYYSSSSDQHIHLFLFWRFLLLYKVAPLQKRLQFLNCSHTLSLGFRWKIKSVRDPHIGFGKLQVATSKSWGGFFQVPKVEGGFGGHQLCQRSLQSFSTHSVLFLFIPSLEKGQSTLGLRSICTLVMTTSHAGMYTFITIHTISHPLKL